MTPGPTRPARPRSSPPAPARSSTRARPSSSRSGRTSSSACAASSRPRARCWSSAPRAPAPWTRPSPTSPPGASACWWPRAATSATAGRPSAPTTASTRCTSRASGAGRSTRPPSPRRCAGEPGIEVVFVTQSETSTGAVSDLPALREAAGDRILVADAVSGLGVVDLPMDRWGIDVVVSGSQKGLMTPPGLAFVAASERAIARSAAPRAGRLLPRLGAHPQGRLAQPVHAVGHARLPAAGGPAPDRGRGAAGRSSPATARSAA